MSKKFGLIGLATVENKYLDGRAALNCSDVTAAEVDKEVMRILKECYEEAKKLLSENRDVMDKIAEYLIEKETITGKEFMKIFREAKGLPEPEEKKDEAKSEETKAEEVKTDEPESEAPKAEDKPEEPKDEEPKPEEPKEEKWEAPKSMEDLKAENEAPVGRFSNTSF